MGYWETIEGKFFPVREDLKVRLDERRESQTIVFTNGCFDLLHIGHLSYLSRARDLGDLLVVAINSDESVRLQGKGPGRPLNTARDRALVLAGLACVDFVTIFPEQTPIETLGILKPGIHTKGGDYKAEDLPEKAVIDSYGGQIEIISFVQGYSTTALINRSEKS